MISGDTIVAAATPLGFSGVAVIRVSGPLAFKIASEITHHSKTNDRVATLRALFDPNGEKLDQGILTCFASPASYTGEDTLEVSSHGNPTIVDNIISTICSHGARLAEPGEFTYRAFINGKMDLIQAEGVASLIRSKTLEGVREQQKIIDGGLSTEINKIRKNLIDLVSSLEYQMDISEDDLDMDIQMSTPKTLNSLQKKVLDISKTFKMGKMLNLGVTVVITGPPNVGKSSLLNYLSGNNKAIVSPLAGTTRDVISLELTLAGVPLLFLDTAGIRKTKSPVEKEGVSRALLHKKQADLIISVSDSPRAAADIASDQPCVFVLNKADLHTEPAPKSVIHISCKNKTGLEDLLLEIKNKLQIHPLSSEVALLSTPRQQAAVNLCAEHIDRAAALFTGAGVELELLSLELRGGIEALDVLLGKTTPDDIINNIFSSLCVGK